MKNPIILKDGKYYNTKTGYLLSEKYGKRLFSFYKRNPGCSLKAARGHKKRTGPNPERNLKIWSRRELENLGYL